MTTRISSSSCARRDSHSLLNGGWLTGRTSQNANSNRHKSSSNFLTDDNISHLDEFQRKYPSHPLLCNMLASEKIRTEALEVDGKKQIFYTKSNDGWFQTVFVLQGRALDRYIVPLAIVTVNAIIWTVVAEAVLLVQPGAEIVGIEGVLSLVVSTTLAFLQVFRLNRSAERYWVARESWGAVVGVGRSFVSGVLIHGSHDPLNRDEVIRWMCAFVLATMYFIRGINTAVPETFAGILEKNEVEDLFHRSDHLPLRAADIVRVGLKKLFTISDDTPFGVAQYRTQQMILLEKQLNDMMMQEGAMERIKSTPLPLVYVTHLRTWLLIFLLAMPYLWQPSLGYITVPVVVLTGFALLGLEGAAQEMEAPFSKDRTGHLNMDAFCLTLLSNIQQQMQEDAERLLHSSLSSYQANLSSDGKMNPQHLEVIDERRNQSA